MNDILISIIIVNYNVKYFLEQCLTSVFRAIEGINAEIYVVDNNSTDGSVEYLRSRFPQVIFIENTSNPGFSKANNQAIELAKGKYILLLNPDTIIGEDILHNLCAFMETHLDAGGVGVKMVDGRGSFLPESKRSFPSPWVSFCKIFGLSKLFPYSSVFAKYSLLYLEADKQHRVDVLSGAFMLLRKEALDKCGLLDASFFMYGEDIDLSYRLVLGGYKNYYLPEKILHYKGESTKHNDIKYIQAFYGAMHIFYKKYYPHSGWLTSSMIKMAIWSKALVDIISRSLRVRPLLKNEHQRMLVVCVGKHYEDIKTIILRKMPELDNIYLWDLRKDSLPKGEEFVAEWSQYTDITFCFPDISFSQILQNINISYVKRKTYHIYNLESKQLVSPGNK